MIRILTLIIALCLCARHLRRPDRIRPAASIIVAAPGRSGDPRARRSLHACRRRQRPRRDGRAPPRGRIHDHRASGFVWRNPVSRRVFTPAASTRTTEYRERYWDPTVLVRGSIAVVWTPYQFWADGKTSHCGIDVFDLLKEQGVWKIANVMWTVEPDACPVTPPQGPAAHSRPRASISFRGASPLGLPYTLSRAPLRRRAPFAWLARHARSRLGTSVTFMRWLLRLDDIS